MTVKPLDNADAALARIRHYGSASLRHIASVQGSAQLKVTRIL